LGFQCGNNNSNNTEMMFYGAVIVTARVHEVHLMNVGQRQAAADPQTRTTNLGCESACRLLSSTSTTAIITQPES